MPFWKGVFPAVAIIGTIGAAIYGVGYKLGAAEANRMAAAHPPASTSAQSKLPPPDFVKDHDDSEADARVSESRAANDEPTATKNPASSDMTRQSMEAIKEAEPQTSELEIPKPTPSSISMFEFEALRTNNDLLPLEKSNRLQSYIGKEITWIGFVREASATSDTDNTDSFYSVYVSPDATLWINGFWCSFPRDTESVVSALKRGDPVRVQGKLTSYSNVRGTKIERIESSDISMQKYLELLENGRSQLSTLKNHVGKYVEWKGVVDAIQTYPHSEQQYYRLDLVVSANERITDYVYCSLSLEGEPKLAGLGKGTSVKIAGVLTGRTEVELTYLKPDSTPLTTGPPQQD
jgi:hypothetical protein